MAQGPKPQTLNRGQSLGKDCSKDILSLVTQGSDRHHQLLKGTFINGGPETLNPKPESHKTLNPKP